MRKAAVLVSVVVTALSLAGAAWAGWGNPNPPTWPPTPPPIIV